jgi:putative inorganic carbon (hco3(-)) transporter
MRVQPLKYGLAAAPDRCIFAVLLVLLLWLPWPWGSRPAAATAVFGLVVGLLAAAQFRLHATGALSPRALPVAARLALWLWLAWLGWIALHLLPLPATLLRALSPASHALHAAAAQLNGLEPLYTLSILPSATVDHLVLSASYAALFWLVLVTVAQDRPRQRMLLNTLLLAGLAQALYGTLMTLSGAEYGFLERKVYGLGEATGTFVNRNHLAGYLEVTLCAGLALILADLRPRPEAGWRQHLERLVELAMSRRLRVRAMLIVMVIGLVLTESRMGNMAFFATLALCGSLYIFLRHKQYFLRSLLLFASIFAVDLLIVSEQFGLERVAARMETIEEDSAQRLAVLPELKPVLDAFLWTGAGPGAYAAASSPYRTDAVQRHFDHPHNDHLEFIIETGVIGYGLLVLLGSVVLAHGFLVVRRRHDTMACALGIVGPMALVTLTLHGFTDFNLRIPAVAATLIALLAVSLSCSSANSAQRSAAADAPPHPGDTADNAA